MLDLAMEPLQLATAVASAFATLIVVATIIHFSCSSRLPPGPLGLPLINNVLDMPTTHQWLTFAEWGRKYGEVMSVRVLGHTVVILESAKAVREILMKRGVQNGGKMRMVMLEYSGWDNNTGLVSSEKFRVVKRFMTKYLGVSSLPPFLMLEEEEITSLLSRVFANPGVVDPEPHLKRMAGSVILRIAYGYKIESDDDYLVDVAQQALELGLTLTNPGWILDTFPWLRFLPDWMLGPSFVRTVRTSRRLVNAIRTIPVEWTKQQLAANKAGPSLAAELLALPTDENTGALFGMLSDLYVAGIDTTVSASRTLLLILALFPDVQAKGQREVDELTRGERLPTHADRPHLPYVSAIVKELYRFRGVANLALPHRATQAMEYNGYIIPEDAILLPNIWSIFHDPAKYPDPFSFSPERYLREQPDDENEVDSEIVNEDPTRYVFGFGPRHCPGRHIADSIVFLLAARVLATCNVSDAVNERGERITPASVEYTGGVVTRPHPYKCTITPRKDADALLASGAAVV